MHRQNKQHLSASSFKMHNALRVFVMVLGKTMNYHKSFLNQLSSKIKLQEWTDMNECDVIIAFVPIVSRAGTDIHAALERIPKHPKIILVALHHTFDPHLITPDSRHSVNRQDIFAVDCLYHEDQGFLVSKVNDEAIERVFQHLGGVTPSPQVQVSWELIAWICVVLSFFFLYFVWLEVYGFFTLLVCEIFLIFVIVLTLDYFSLAEWRLLVVTGVNIVLTLIASMTNQQDVETFTEIPEIPAN